MSELKMHDYLLANTILPEPTKLELDLKMLFSKEAFNQLIKDNVSKNTDKKNDD